MFCDACGAQLQPGQSYCGRCGKTIIGPVAVGGRVARHLHVLGILWIAYSALHLTGGAVLMILSKTLFPHLRTPVFVAPLLSFIGLFLLVKGFAGLAGGVGLMQRQPWARVLTIVVGCVSLINVPLGTALGVYTLWALVSPGADREWEALAGGGT